MTVLPPELIHKIALSGWLGVEDVAALGQTCRRMASILVWDGYGRDLHGALVGVAENVRRGRWRSAKFAVNRRWFGEDGVGEEREWMVVANVVTREEVKVLLTDQVEVEEWFAGWEEVMLAVLSLPGAEGYLDTWAPDEKWWMKTCLLHVAAKIGAEKLVAWVLERGGNVGGGAEKGSPLAAACNSGHLGVVKKLVEAGADVGAEVFPSENLMFTPSRRGHVGVVAYLLGLGLDVNKRNGRGMSLIAVTCGAGSVEVVKLLVEAGANLSVGGEGFYNPFVAACRRGNVAVVEYLLELGVWVENGVLAAREAKHADVLEVLESWQSRGEGLVGLAPELVHRVALGGWLGVEDVAALGQTCRRMAETLVWDGYGRDLHMALRGVMVNVRGGRWSSARYAVNRRWLRGEDGEEDTLWRRVGEAVVGEEKVELPDEKGLAGWENVLMEALAFAGPGSLCLESWMSRKSGIPETSLLHIAAAVGSVRTVDWVLERGGSTEVLDFVDATPLWVACQKGNLGVVKQLVEAGADAGVKDVEFQGLLHAVCEGGDADVARYLLDLDAIDVEAEDVDDVRSVSEACFHGHLDLVKVLVEEGGAGVDVMGEEEFGPLVMACRGGQVDVVEYLVERGAGSGVGKDESGGVWIEGLVGASENGHLDVVRLLLGLGVDVDGADRYGNVAVVSAWTRGCGGVVDVLLEWGAQGLELSVEEKEEEEEEGIGE